jgi:hypothetical protein
MRSLLLLVLLWVPSLSLAQTSGSDRLFLAFIEDTAIAQEQWWEGQLEFSEADDVDATVLRGIVALQPWQKVELGGRMGFGDTDTGTDADGSGATDLDVWGKYNFGEKAEKTEFAVGGEATIPTGDDSAGLGFDAFSLGAFGAMRYRWPELILAAHAGLRMTGDGRILGVDLDGQTSLLLGGGVIWPLSDEVTLVGELSYEGERFEETDTDARALGGLNWRPFNRGIVRGALAFGLSDGAPDLQLLAGYAAQF